MTQANGDYTGAANQLDLWNKGGGQVLAGLVRRRAAEKALFLEMTTNSETAAAANVNMTYTVVSGDTLSGIAAKFGTTVDSLVAINGIANPNVIGVGQVIRLTDTGTTALGVGNVQVIA